MAKNTLKNTLKEKEDKGKRKKKIFWKEDQSGLSMVSGVKTQND